jgi:hypothetical protein
MATNSKYVFVGKIVEIRELDSSGANTNVVVSVEKWLKGDEQDDTIQARIDAPAAILAAWKSRASRLLIFDDLPRDASNIFAGGRNAIDLSDPDLKVLTADMKVLTDSEQILHAAQEAINRHPGVYGISVFRKSLPDATAQMLGHPNQPVRLLGNYPDLVTSVPADEDLERWALSALDSKHAWERAEAASALGNFHSEVNTVRLKRLLDDPALIGNGHGNPYYYFVRANAYESLMRMGAKVPKPVLQKGPVT